MHTQQRDYGTSTFEQNLTHHQRQSIYKTRHGIKFANSPVMAQLKSNDILYVLRT